MSMSQEQLVKTMHEFEMAVSEMRANVEQGATLEDIAPALKELRRGLDEILKAE